MFIEIETNDVVDKGIGGTLGVVLETPPEWFDFGEIGGIGEKLVEAIDDEAAKLANRRVCESFDDDFRADACGVADCDADDGLAVRRSRRGGIVFGWDVWDILNHWGYFRGV